MAATIDDVWGQRRWPWGAAAIAAAGHGAVIAALVTASGEPMVTVAPSVLAVHWAGEPTPEVVPPPPKPEPPKPRPRHQPPRPQPVHLPAAAAVPAAEPTVPEAPPVAAPAPAPAAAAAAMAAPAPLPVSAPRFNADYLSNPAPRYPAASRSRGEEGKVLLRVLVSPAGEAEEVRLHAGSGYERLDTAALDAVRHWKFVPARRGAEAVAAWVIVPISFTLRR